MIPKTVVLHPGFVRSRHDGDRHFITGTMLICLYGVRRGFDRVHTTGATLGTADTNPIHLYPSRSGKYTNIHDADRYERLSTSGG